MINRATGESKKHSLFIKNVVDIKPTLEIITNNKTNFGFNVPLGISLILAVRGFFKSISLSIYLLKAMAADRAKIIQIITRIKTRQFIPYC